MCPDDNALAAYVDETCSTEDATAILQHLQVCEQCRRIVMLFLLDLKSTDPPVVH